MNLLALLVIGICGSGFVVSSSSVYCWAGPKDGGKVQKLSAADEVGACLFNLSEHVLQAVDLWGTK